MGKERRNIGMKSMKAKGMKKDRLRSVTLRSERTRGRIAGFSFTSRE
jgi:hypothetical protein